MKWNSTFKGHVAEEGIYSLECTRRFSTTGVYGLSGGCVQEQPAGWAWRVFKDGKPWKKGPKRLLADAKAAAEKVVPRGP